MTSRRHTRWAISSGVASMSPCSQSARTAGEGRGHGGGDERRLGGADEFALGLAAGAQVLMQYAAQRASAARAQQGAVERGMRGQLLEERQQRGRRGPRIGPPAPGMQGVHGLAYDIGAGVDGQVLQVGVVQIERGPPDSSPRTSAATLTSDSGRRAHSSSSVRRSLARVRSARGSAAGVTGRRGRRPGRACPAAPERTECAGSRSRPHRPPRR